MIKRTSLLILALLAGMVCGAAADAQLKPQPKPSAPAARTAKHSTTPVAKQNDDDGDLIWQQQCSRCHNAPTGFSPRIAGTVVRHMRVRASLSKHQEEQLLSFLNP